MTPRGAARRLLLLVTDLKRGGTPTVVRELAVRLAAAHPSLHVEVACLAGFDPVAAELHDAGITVTALHARGRFDPRVILRFISVVREHQIDTVLSFLVHANVVAAAASVVLSEVRWLQSIQTTQPWPRWHWVAQRWAAAAAESIAVPSASVASAAHHWSGIAADQIVVIPNAIELAEFADVAVPADDARPFPIVFVGRLDPVKDVPTLVDAVARLKGLVHLKIFGDGADRSRIERSILHHRAGAWVTMCGSVARPADALSGAGALVLPSLAEGFGLVLIEAMAAGVPVVATDVLGIRDVVRHDVTGLLVPPQNSGALAEAIRQITADAPMRRRLIDAGRADVAVRFTWESVLPMYARWLGVTAAPEDDFGDSMSA